jgi:hypothetical protein
MGKTHSKPLVARHGRGTAWQGKGMGAAWAWHAMCESAFRESALYQHLEPNICIQQTKKMKKKNEEEKQKDEEQEEEVEEKSPVL